MTDFDWRSDRPRHRFASSLETELVAAMQRREACVVFGGRGMGKSVLLRGIGAALEAAGEGVLGVWHGDEAPSLRAAVLATLGRPEAASLVDALEARVEVQGPQVVIIDDADRWRDPAETRRALDALGTAQRERLGGQLGLLVAGGVGAFRLASQPFGSPFASRINRRYDMRPLALDALKTWAQPLSARDPRYDDLWLEGAWLATGGVPLLLAAVLGEGSRRCETGAQPPEPVAWLSEFLAAQDGFRRSVRSSVGLDVTDSTASRLLAEAGRTPDAVSLAVLEGQGISTGESEDTARLLMAAGLLRGDPEPDGDWLRVAPTSSLLRFHRARRPRLSEVEAAIRAAVGELVHHAVDLFHGARAQRALVPEATLSAFLAVQLRARRWDADREAHRGLGRTDLLVKAPGVAGEAVVEVKIWPRNDSRELHAQLQSYLQADALLGVAVMVALHDLPDDEYAAAVLPQPPPPAERQGVISVWRVVGQGAHGQSVPLVHLLVRLLRR